MGFMKDLGLGILGFSLSLFMIAISLFLGETYLRTNGEPYSAIAFVLGGFAYSLISILMIYLGIREENK
jgi:hypothetical protein